MEMPKLSDPREACIAALAVLIHGGVLIEAQKILNEAGCVVNVTRGPSAATALVQISARKKFQATAGNACDALAFALRDSLGVRDGATQ